MCSVGFAPERLRTLSALDFICFRWKMLVVDHLSSFFVVGCVEQLCAYMRTMNRRRWGFCMQPATGWKSDAVNAKQNVLSIINSAQHSVKAFFHNYISKLNKSGWTMCFLSTRSLSISLILLLNAVCGWVAKQRPHASPSLRASDEYSQHFSNKILSTTNTDILSLECLRSRKKLAKLRWMYMVCRECTLTHRQSTFSHKFVPYRGTNCKTN